MAIEVKMNRHLKNEKEDGVDFVYKSDEWVFSMNNKGEFTYSNLKVEELLGYSPSDLVGKPFSQFVIEKQEADIMDDSQNIAGNDSKSYQRKITFLHRSGHAVQLVSAKTPIINAAGKRIGFFARGKR